MNFHHKGIVFSAIVFSTIVLFSTFPIQEHKSFHSPAELDSFKNLNLSSADPVDPSVIFPTFDHCEGCHGHDLQMNGMVDADGNDVNVVDNWRATMMANSAKDPFWRAKVSHEILVNPQHSLDLQTKCTSCHAPNGHYTAILRGAAHYTIEEMLLDTVAMDGVNCGSCHMISEDGLGETFSGEINYDTSRVMYGPYEFPFSQPMTSFVGFEAKYSEHINDAGICASCHTLLTKSVDLEGNYTGEEFVEQATYHEWLNSAYNSIKGPNKASCQACHMPRIDDTVVISANYIFLQGRSPFALHELVGGNSTMLKMMKEHKDELGINATDEDFDKVITNTMDLLENQTVSLTLNLEEADTDTAYFSVGVENRAGHKMPSGYPSRRSFVEFVALKDNGDTLFQSGVIKADYEVKGQEVDTEPHYNVINNEEQVQIYELVLGDVDGNFTTVLERSHQALKDNRLPPLGFTKDHMSYDTTRIYGKALSDPNFNFDGGLEGSGTDIIRYHIPFGDYEGEISVSAKIFYQALPPKWMAPMFQETTPEIEVFREMYLNADLSPVLMDSQFLDGVYVSPVDTKDPDAETMKVYPNPTFNNRVYINGLQDEEVSAINIFDEKGVLLSSVKNQLGNSLTLPDKKGLIIIEIITKKNTFRSKVINL